MIRVLIVGCGNMGASHADAYHRLTDFIVVGLVSRGKSAEELNAKKGWNYPVYQNFELALAATRPDAVCISTYPDTHARYAEMAMRAGADVFLEKPIATTLADAQRVVAVAQQWNRKLVIGYILRHHPSWIRFIEESKNLGKPLVMRMNLNQQSSGRHWETHLQLMKELSPIVDCGVHYIDVMCQMTRSKPLQVYAIGARLSPEVPLGNYNYGQLQIKFEDGSVGWYEAGWGPMMSEQAYFIKDVIGPNGAVSMVADPSTASVGSEDIDAHTKVEKLLVHAAQLQPSGAFQQEDRLIHLEEEPSHQELCDREQKYFYQAITEKIDLNEHWQDAINSLQIALAADESVRTGQVILLQ